MGLLKDARFAAGVLRKRPLQCLVQVTNRCNMRCSFCDFWPNGVPRAQELTVADYQRISDELAELGTCLVSIEGGEPLVRPDLVDIVRAFARHHLPVLFTNGWFVDEAFARAVFAAGAVQVGVSIDFPDAPRHDAKRGLGGAHARAWNAVRLLTMAAPEPRAVHVMTVLMKDNQHDLPALLEQSKGAGVGHAITLLATGGYRRGSGEASPDPRAIAGLPALWQQHTHLRAFRQYIEGIGPFLQGEPLPGCNAGAQSFNIDHVGGVAACIEKIDKPFGNVRDEPLGPILARMRAAQPAAGCQACWTLCRGFAQTLGNGASPTALVDLARRMRVS